MIVDIIRTRVVSDPLAVGVDVRRDRVARLIGDATGVAA
jgi:hypothetical protein